MEKYCISLPQAKRLVELGFEHDFRHQWYEVESPTKGTLVFFDDIPTPYDHRESKLYPAYHVGGLGEILPPRCISAKCSDKYEKTRGNFIAYSQRAGEAPRMYGETEAQARGELLIYLLENNLI